MKRILVPTDFSKTSLIALEVACEIAKKGGAEVVALHVVEEPGSDSFRVTGEVPPKNFEDRLYTLKLLEKSKKMLEKLVMDPKYNAIKLNGELRLGNPFHGMNTIITEQKVDLVVMGTQGHSRLQEMIIGSNTEKVVRHSKVPVLSVHKKPAKVNFKNIVYATAMSKDEEKFSKVATPMIQPKPHTNGNGASHAAAPSFVPAVGPKEAEMGGILFRLEGVVKKFNAGDEDAWLDKMGDTRLSDLRFLVEGMIRDLSPKK